MNPIFLRKKDSIETLRVISQGRKKAFFLMKYAFYISKDGKLLTRKELYALNRIKSSIKNDEIIDQTLRKIYSGMCSETIKSEQREKLREEIIIPCRAIIDKYVGESFKELMPSLDHELMVSLFESLCNAFYLSDPLIHPNITSKLFKRTTYCYRYLRCKDFFESEFSEEITNSVKLEIEDLQRNFPFV